MKYALRSLLSLGLLGAGCSPQETGSGEPIGSVDPASTSAPAQVVAETPPHPSTTVALEAEPEDDGKAVDEEVAEETPPMVDALGSPSIYSGVYTEEQAARGLAIQEQECVACHSPDDWGGGSVLLGYTGMTAYDLVNRLRETMPMDEPGRLSLQQYTDLAALIFKLNGAPAGSEELSSDPSELARVRLEYRR